MEFDKKKASNILEPVAADCPQALCAALCFIFNRPCPSVARDYRQAMRAAMLVEQAMEFFSPQSSNATSRRFARYDYATTLPCFVICRDFVL